MEKLTPKIDDALGALIEFLPLREKGGYFDTIWGKKTLQGLKLSIVNQLHQYGVVLSEENL